MTDPHARWRRIDELLEAALDLPEEQRGPFLRGATDDEEVRASVLELLDVENDDDGFLESTGPEIPTELLDEGTIGLGAGLAEGARVDRYRIVSPLGRGGMSMVYLAERADGQFDQRVALKILRSDLDSEELAGRIRTERQILASLDHQGIARVFDGGVTGDGRPYLVIEVVEGQRIDRHSDERALSVPQRLELFTQVCRAVQYAHQNLVVHRDLKPSNILVTDVGNAKLLDFGIAKLLDAPSAGGAEATVGPATRWMTPEYAAPEQILGKPVTTATDVHALGAILYELLSGHKPFGGDSKSGYALEKAICEELPEPPSTVSGRTTEGGSPTGSTRVTPEEVARQRSSEPERLRRTLGGDLDAIVLKALRKEPEERYASVGALLDDLERYQSGFPVRARGGARAYRFRKFAARHRVAVAAAAGFVVLLAGSAALLSVQQAATAIERDRANEAAALALHEAENAQLVTDFLADVFRGRNPNQAPADTVTARELLAWGLERVDSEFADRPAVQADLLTVMGSAHFNLGLLEEAIALHERSVALRRALYGDDDSHVADGLAMLADAHESTRHFEAALPLSREVLAIRRQALGPEHAAIAGALAGLGQNLRDVGRPDTAEVLLREAVDMRSRTDGEDSEAYVQNLLELAFVLRRQNKLAEAEAVYREAIPKYRKVAPPDDTNLPAYLNNFAYLLKERNELASAVPVYREALALLTDLYGPGHPNSLLIANNLAGTLQEMGAHAEAVSVLAESLSAAQMQWPGDHYRVARSHLSLGIALLRGAQLEEAEAQLNAAVQMNDRLAGGPVIITRSVGYAALGACLILQGRAEQGQPMLDNVYGSLADLANEAGGTIPFVQSRGLASILQVLEYHGLEQEMARFEALFPEGWRS